jgi:hypothetical protein
MESENARKLQLVNVVVEACAPFQAKIFVLDIDVSV